MPEWIVDDEIGRDIQRIIEAGEDPSALVEAAKVKPARFKKFLAEAELDEQLQKAASALLEASKRQSRPRMRRDLNKTELTEALASAASLTKADAQRAVDALFDTETGVIAKALRRSGKVQITGFGTFETRKRKVRTGRNPRTGQRIQIPAAKAVGFRAGKGLKDAVN